MGFCPDCHSPFDRGHSGQRGPRKVEWSPVLFGRPTIFFKGTVSALAAKIFCARPGPNAVGLASSGFIPAGTGGFGAPFDTLASRRRTPNSTLAKHTLSNTFRCRCPQYAGAVATPGCGAIASGSTHRNQRIDTGYFCAENTNRFRC